MTPTETIDFAREAIWVLLEIAAPAMLTALVVGLTIGLLQALTQIQEMTLVFVPKIIAIFVALLIALPFMADKLDANFIRITAHITGG
jgi:flagellar biosynthesis protein FliQ